MFTGIIEEAGKDHLIIKDIENKTWYLIRIIYLDFVEFPDQINYLKEFSAKNY